MFCSRVCSNVELEVGNLIRLFPPWYDPQSGLFLKCKLFTILECRSCLSSGNLATSQKTLERIFCHVEVKLC